MVAQGRQFHILQAGVQPCGHSDGNAHLYASNKISYSVECKSCGLQMTVWYEGADQEKPKAALIAHAVALASSPRTYE